MSIDEKWMRRAIVLAQKGRGRTSPNPMVGAVLVRGGRVLAEGHHARAGGPHAEAAAIAKARTARGATLYVTLEPCSTHGRTPPCVDAILKAGIRRVVIGAIDPNPRHRGRGVRLLRGAGVRVRSGVLGREAAALNPAFNRWMTAGRPWVIAKAAMTLDGKIATRTGDSKWITSPRARRIAHRWRSQADAILVGVNTVIRDNPRLTVRGMPRCRPLLRIVLDPRGRTPPDCRLLRTAKRQPTLMVTGSRLAEAALRRFRKSGAAVWKFTLRNRRLPLHALLRRLGRNEITSLLVEGGSETLGGFFDARLVDQVLFFYAPKLVGGRGAIKAIGGQGVRRMIRAPIVHGLRVERIGDELVATGFLSARARA